MDHAHPDERVRFALEQTVGRDLVEQAWRVYQASRIAGLCHDGAWEAAVGSVKDAGSEKRHMP